MSNTQGNDIYTPGKTEEREAPSRSLSAVLAGWPMSPFRFLFDRRAKRYTVILAVMLAVIIILSTVLLIGGRSIYFSFTPKSEEEIKGDGVASAEGDFPYADGAEGNVLLSWSEEAVAIPEKSLYSSYAALADLSTGEIIASRKANEEIYPASMTKVMTLIVVVENLPDENCLKDEITISQSVCHAMTSAGSSGIGLEAGEKISVESLLYALILKSDGVAACELARYVAGSEEDFVKLMNEKAAEMGLTSTHFENPTGLFHPDHKSTAREIASIMAYAMNMKLCRKVMLTQSYNAPCVGVDGKTFSYNLYHSLIVTQFDKIPVNQPDTVKVAAAKTGFTDESRFCLVTYAESADGHGYVCVTAKGDSYNACVADYITIYNTYAKP